MSSRLADVRYAPLAARPATSSIRIGVLPRELPRAESAFVATELERITGEPTEFVPVYLAADALTGEGVDALRAVLRAGVCDLVVHDLKSLSMEPEKGLTFVTPLRWDPRNALCAAAGTTLATLPRGALVGTASPQRVAQLRTTRPDLEIVAVKGSLESRLARVFGPNPGDPTPSSQVPCEPLDAVVVAYADLVALDRLDAVAEVLSVNAVAPAAGQGTLAVEARTADTAADARLGPALAALDDLPTRLATGAERAMLSHLHPAWLASVGTWGRVVDEQLILGAIRVGPGGASQVRHRSAVTLPPGWQRMAHDLSGALLLDEIAHELGIRVAKHLSHGPAPGIPAVVG